MTLLQRWLLCSRFELAAAVSPQRLSMKTGTLLSNFIADKDCKGKGCDAIFAQELMASPFVLISWMLFGWVLPCLVSSVAAAMRFCLVFGCRLLVPRVWKRLLHNWHPVTWHKCHLQQIRWYFNAVSFVGSLALWTRFAVDNAEPMNVFPERKCAQLVCPRYSYCLMLFKPSFLLGRHYWHEFDLTWGTNGNV